MNLQDILLNVIRSRILPLYTRVRLILSPGYLKGRLVEFIRIFLSNVLNVKPKDKNDYYPVARWLVSKRLAYAIVIISIVICIVYIMMARSALFPGRGENHIKTYNYNSILLKFASGKVRILGKSGYLAYEGDVSEAACNGEGTLMNPKGVVVYEGNFGSNMYEGVGKQYYEDGTMEHEGEFHRNEYSGEGKHFRSNGSLEYDGSYSQNMKDGEGKLYNTGGEVVYTGEFSKDEVLYSSLIGKDSGEMATVYTGERKLYVNGNERIRECKDIGAMTEELLDENSIDDAAVVQAVYVMKDYIRIGKRNCRSFSDLESAFGKPTYTGASYATLGELLLINRLNEQSDVDVLNGPADITEEERFTEFTNIDGYDDSYEVWLHSYEKDGLVYNFVSLKDDTEFAFYYILKGDLSDEN